MQKLNKLRTQKLKKLETEESKLKKTHIFVQIPFNKKL